MPQKKINNVVQKLIGVGGMDDKICGMELKTSPKVKVIYNMHANKKECKKDSNM